MSDPIYLFIAVGLSLIYPTGIEPLTILKNESSLILIPAITIFSILCYLFITFLLYRWVDSARLASKLLIFPLYIFIIFFCHLPYYTDKYLGLGNSTLFYELVVLSPFLIMLAGNWLISSVARVAQASTIFQLKVLIAIGLFPLVLMLLANDIISRSEFITRLFTMYPLTALLYFVVIMPIIIILAPIFVRFILMARDIRHTELAQRLAKICQEVGLSLAKLFEFSTGKPETANAFIIGPLARLRYIFFSDSIIKQMPQDMLECVLAHEIAHVKKQHMRSYFYLALIFITLLTIIYGSSGAIISSFFVVIIAGLWIFIFSFISKRFETEADIFAAKLVGSYQLMVQALVSVATVNRSALSVGSLRHFSIQKRIQLLQTAEANPLFETDFMRMCSTMRRILVFSFFICIIYFIFLIIADIQDKPARESEYNMTLDAMHAIELIEQKDYLKAETILKQVCDQVKYGPFHLHLAQAQLKIGKIQEARMNLKKAESMWIQDPSDRLLLDELINSTP